MCQIKFEILNMLTSGLVTSRCQLLVPLLQYAMFLLKKIKLPRSTINEVARCVLDRCVSTHHAHQHSCSGIDFVKSLNQLQHVSMDVASVLLNTESNRK